MTSEKKITICIVHYRRLSQLKKAIEYLDQNTFNNYKLKILNNGYIDNDIEGYLSELDKRDDIEIVYSQKNLGPGEGRNILISDIDTPFAVTMDDDVYMTVNNWDVPIINMLERDDDVGAIGVSLYDTSGNFVRLGANNVKIEKGVVRFSPYLGAPPNYSKDFFEVDSLGCVIVYRREINDYIKVGSECQMNDDWERAVKLKKMPYSCLVYLPSRAIHDQWSTDPSFIEYNKSRRDYHKIRQDYLLLIKNTGLKLDFWRHIFYKYGCLLPNNIIREVAYRWLNK